MNYPDGFTQELSGEVILMKFTDDPHFSDYQGEAQDRQGQLIHSRKFSLFITSNSEPG